MRLLMNMTLIMIDPAARASAVVTAREEGDKLVLDVEALGPVLEAQGGGARRAVRRGAGRRLGRRGGPALLHAACLAEEAGFTLRTAHRRRRPAGLTAIGRLTSRLISTGPDFGSTLSKTCLLSEFLNSESIYLPKHIFFVPREMLHGRPAQ